MTHQLLTTLPGSRTLSGEPTLLEVRTLFGKHAGKSRLGRLCLAICLVLAAFWAPQVAAQTPPSPKLSNSYHQALFLPLDDRPSTYLFPQQIARIGGGKLVVPPRHLLGNADTAGSCAELASWLQNNASVAPTAIISADMLAYGGLVASRTAAPRKEEALNHLRALESLHAQGQRVVVFAILPRLSLRTSDGAAPYEEALRNWATRDCQNPPEKVPERYRQEYLEVRARNISVITSLLDLVEAGTIDRLVLGQDDASKTGVHLREQNMLRDRISEKRISQRVTLISGADELAMTLVSGWLCREQRLSPELEIVYSDPEQSAKVPPMESLPLRDTVASHLKLSGAREVTGRGTILLIQCPSETPYAAPSNTDSAEQDPVALAQIRQCLATGRPLALTDIRLINRADPVLARTLLQSVDLWQLEAYAAWNTPSNSVGTAIAQATMHSIARQRGSGWALSKVLESEKTQQAFTLARMVDDYAYQALIRPTLSQYVKGLPRNPHPLLNLYGPAGVEARLAAIDWAQQMWDERLQGRTFPLPSHKREVSFERMAMTVVLPWPRIFEIEARIDIRLAPKEEHAGQVHELYLGKAVQVPGNI